MALCYINGTFMPLEEASLPVSDFIILRGWAFLNPSALSAEGPLCLPRT